MGKIAVFISGLRYIFGFVLFAAVFIYIAETNPKAEKLLIKITEKITGEYINENHEL